MKYFVQEVRWPSKTVPGRIDQVYRSRPDDGKNEPDTDLIKLAFSNGVSYQSRIIEIEV